MTQKINVALLGFGLSGKVFHLPFLIANSGLNIQTILSSKKEIKENYPDINVTTHLDDILNDSKIDLIINALPNELHYEVSKKALLAGKHVVIEKPFVNTLAEGKELIEIAKAQNKTLTIFHNRRLDDDYCLIKKLISSKELGEVTYFESRFDRFSPIVKGGWRDEQKPGSGVYFDLAPHLLDQALDLFGLPNTYQVRIETQRENAKVDDYFEINLTYPNLNVLLTAGCLVKEKTYRFTVKGSHKTLKSLELDPQESLLKENIKINSTRWNEAINNSYAEIHFDDAVEKIKRPFIGYGVFYENLVKHINGKAPLLIKPEEALTVMELLIKGKENQNVEITLK